jgi:NADH-quinone oxidoreductase subunit C
MIPDQLRNFQEASQLEEEDPSVLAGGQYDRGELTLEAPPEKLVAACRWFRARGYNLLSSITATDLHPLEPRFRVVYHLYAVAQHKPLRLAVRVGGADPRLESMIPVWPSANWYERELFDLFGIRFDGHPNLKRIMLPDDWEGHPLRKDYPTEGIR